MAQQPIRRFQCGLLSVSVWVNRVTDGAGSEREFVSVSIDRSFRDSAGQWQSTKSFGFADVPVLVALLKDAYRFIAEREDAVAVADEGV